MFDPSYYMQKAYLEAKKALKYDEVPIGAIIVKDNKIIARSYNKKEKDKLATSHAEILAINKASKKLNSWHLDGCIMFVTLEPCMMCMGAIVQSRIKTVYYSAKSFQDGAIESSINFHKIIGLNHYPETIYFEKNECSKIITDYFKTKR